MTKVTEIDLLNYSRGASFFFLKTTIPEKPKIKIENKESRAAEREEIAKKRVEVARSPSAATSYVSTLMSAH